MKQCTICNLTFESGRSYSNHIRWKHKNIKYHSNRNCVHCGGVYAEHNISNHEARCSVNPVNIKHCKQCNKILVQRNGIFCSRSCAATFNNTGTPTTFKVLNFICIQCSSPFSRKNIAHNKMCDRCNRARRNKFNRARRSQLTIQVVCSICNASFNKKVWSNRTTCSSTCLRKLHSNKSRAGNCGGETNYRKLKYNNIYMDSSWEVEIAVWLDEHSIEWVRSRTIVFLWTDKDGHKRRYYPDFYLPKYKLYLDPKNSYKLAQDKFKLEQVIKENNINLVYGHKDLIIQTLMGL